MSTTSAVPVIVVMPVYLSGFGLTKFKKETIPVAKELLEQEQADGSFRYYDTVGRNWLPDNKVVCERIRANTVPLAQLDAFEKDLLERRVDHVTALDDRLSKLGFKADQMWSGPTIVDWERSSGGGIGERVFVAWTGQIFLSVTKGGACRDEGIACIRDLEGFKHDPVLENGKPSLEWNSKTEDRVLQVACDILTKFSQFHLQSQISTIRSEVEPPQTFALPKLTEMAPPSRAEAISDDDEIVSLA